MCSTVRQEVGVRGGLGRLVDHDRRPDQPLRRHGGDVLAVLAADPVDRRVEVRADVLADLEPVPRPRRPAVVVAADLVPRQARRVRERRRELEDGRVLAERLGEVDDLHGGQHLGERLGHLKASSSHSAQKSGVIFASTTSGPSRSASQGSIAARSSSPRTVTPARAGGRGQRGEVGVGELHELDRVAVRAEVVDLRAVGGVVVDHDEHRQPQAGERLELGQRHQRAAVAEAGDGQAVRPRDGGAHAAGQAEADRLERLREHEAGRIGDAQVHRREAHEVAGVDGDGAVVRQQRVEGDRERPRVDAAVAADVVVRLVAPRAGGDLRGQRVVADAGALHARVEQRPRRRGGVADHGGVDRRAPAASGSRSTWTTLAPGSISAPSRVVQRVSEAPNASTRSDSGDQPRGDRRGEAAGDPHRPRRAGEQPVAHRGGGEHGADGVAERLERLARARRAPRRGRR